MSSVSFAWIVFDDCLTCNLWLRYISSLHMLRGGTFDSQWSKEGKVFSLLYCLSRLCFFSLGSLPTCKGCSNTLWRETSNPQYGSTEVTKIFIGIVIVLILNQGWEFYVLRTRGFQSTMISLKSCVLIVLGVGKVQSTKLLNGRDFLFGGGRLIWSRKSNRVKSPLWCRRLNFLWYISCSSDQHLKRGRKTVQ